MTAYHPTGTLYRPAGIPLFPASTDQNNFEGSGATAPWYVSTTPSAQYFATVNWTILTWESWDGRVRNIYGKYYDHALGIWSADFYVTNDTLTDDSHGAPSICQTPDGYFWIFGGAHHSAMKYWRSNSINSVTAWTEQTNFGSYSYPHPDVVGATIYLIMRGNGASVLEFCSLRPITIAAGVPTVGAEVNLVDYGVGTRFYQGNHLIIGTDIYICSAFAPGDDSYRQDVYCYVYSTVDGSVRNLQNTFSTAAGSLPVDYASAQTNYRIVNQKTPGNYGNTPSMAADNAGNIHFFYNDGVPADNQYYCYHKFWNGSALSTPFLVGTLPPGDLHRYDAQAIVQRSDGGVGCYFCTDDGLAYGRGGNISKRIRSSSGTWGSVTLVRASTALNALDRPVGIRDGLSSLEIIFTEITQDDITESGLLSGYAQNESGAYIVTPYGPDVQSWLAQMSTQPSTAVKVAMKNYVDALRAQVGGNPSIWERTYGLWWLASPDAAGALINVRGPQWDLSLVGAPTFGGAYAGYTAGTNAYFDTGYDIGTGASATSFSLDLLIDPGAGSTGLAGCTNGNDLNFAQSSTTLTFKVADSAAGISVANVPVGVAHYCGNRTGTAQTIYQNAVSIGTATATNAAFASNHLWIGHRTATSATAKYYHARHGFSMTLAQVQLAYASARTLLNIMAPGTMP